MRGDRVDGPPASRTRRLRLRSQRDVP